MEARGDLLPADPDESAALYELTQAMTATAGLPAYEVSNFARSHEHRSRHNQKYWHHVPYLGVGPSAHSFAGKRRWWNERKLGPYERRIEAGEKPIEESEDLTRSDLALEALMLGLRTTDGVDSISFRERYGVDLLKSNEPLAERLVTEGLLKLEGNVLVPTLAGLAVTDSLARAFDLGQR